MPNPTILQLDNAVAEVFRVMLGLACTPQPHPLPSSLIPLPSLHATVLFSGSHGGSCVLGLDLPGAALLASTLTDLAPAEIDSGLMADTAGELCNMIAGSWKAAQCSTDCCTLSCPTMTFSGLPPAPSPRDIERHYRFAIHQRLTVTLAPLPVAPSALP